MWPPLKFKILEAPLKRDFCFSPTRPVHELRSSSCTPPQLHPKRPFHFIVICSITLSPSGGLLWMLSLLHFQNTDFSAQYNHALHNLKCLSHKRERKTKRWWKNSLKPEFKALALAFSNTEVVQDRNTPTLFVVTNRAGRSLSCLCEPQALPFLRAGNHPGSHGGSKRSRRPRGPGFPCYNENQTIVILTYCLHIKFFSWL